MTPVETLREAARQARQDGDRDGDLFTLCLAEWLDEQAIDENYELAPSGTTDAALAVARAYLGEQP